MKLVVDLPDSLVGRVRDAVQEGGYEDAREFVTVAIENQLEIEEEDSAGGVVSLDRAIEGLDDEPSESEAESTTVDPDPSSDVDIGRHEYDHVVPVESPPDSKVDGGPLWGQYNRILPVKFVVRRLANDLRDIGPRSGDSPSQTSLDEFKDGVARAAREFGMQLESADERHSRGRGEKFSAGFPTGDQIEKSIDRFQSHFVGYLDRNGKLTGAPPALRFVDVSDEEDPRVGLTSAGLEFASLPNPVLDGSVETEVPLSRDEREFYVEYVAAELPDELHAMVHTARAIDRGDDRPTSLTERVAELNDDWSEAQGSTNRSGLVSRMSELGFVDRHRVGQRGVGYELTEEGDDFLTTHSSE